MLEQQRADYLKSMGITLWMPRSQLPYAPESRWLPQAMAERHEHIAMAQVEHGARPVAAADLLKVGQPSSHINPSAISSPVVSTEILSKEKQSTEIQPKSERHSSELTNTKADAVDLTPPRFRLEFLRVSEHGVWVMDSHAPIDELQRFAYRVFTGMRQPVDFMPPPVSFAWPFIESNHQDQSESVATQALSVQWQFFRSQGVRYILTFGDEAHHWMKRIEAVPHYHIENLQQLQATPVLKRQLWLSLQRLPIL